VRYAAINGCQEDRCPKSKRMGQNLKNINPQLAFNIAYVYPKLSEIIIG
jgi:hypothetical protein